MSVAKNLIDGHILEDRITRDCRILTIFEGTNEVLRLYLAQATGVGRDKILSTMPQLLRDAAGIYERYAVELARTCDFLLRKCGKLIADQQHALKRVADIAVDLFVGLCVLSRAATLAGSAWPITYGVRNATRTKR